MLDGDASANLRAVAGRLALLSIETWQHAVVFIGPDEPHVVWMNSEAERLLRVEGIGVSGGRLQFPNREIQREFDAFVAAAGPEVGTFVVDAKGEGVPLVVRCRSLDEAGHRLLSIFHPENPPTTIPEVGSLFGLTPAEGRVLQAITDGKRAEDLAADLSISIETARTHIRRIYNKLGVSSREQLIAKVGVYRVP